ncbi:FkbM family methyltransferase [Catalinimonas sp. 4WD22]|uniref:FkbM family methyltransferase n=1 Tax=Catalinimonas locisalis TaxID=3133978 RepID=UPI003100C3E5
MLPVIVEDEGHRGAASLSAEEVVHISTLSVEVDRFDKVFSSDEDIHLMKIDVEGHESNVLTGCGSLLKMHKIKHVIFEEHMGYPAKSIVDLQKKGYKLYRIGKSFTGPKLISPEDNLSFSLSWEPKNYLATCDDHYVQSRMK